MSCAWFKHRGRCNPPWQGKRFQFRLKEGVPDSPVSLPLSRRSFLTSPDSSRSLYATTEVTTTMCAVASRVLENPLPAVSAPTSWFGHEALKFPRLRRKFLSGDLPVTPCSPRSGAWPPFFFLWRRASLKRGSCPSGSLRSSLFPTRK